MTSHVALWLNTNVSEAKVIHKFFLIFIVEKHYKRTQIYFTSNIKCGQTQWKKLYRTHIVNTWMVWICSVPALALCSSPGVSRLASRRAAGWFEGWGQTGCPASCLLMHFLLSSWPRDLQRKFPLWSWTTTTICCCCCSHA